MAREATAAETSASRRGRPRSERSRQAILSAVNELMLERDLSEISMEAVAARAGASKATIYRWWPSKELLALEALRSDWEASVPEAPDTGSLAGDLRALMLPWTRELAAKPYARVIAALVARTHADTEFAGEYRTRFVAARRAHGRAAFLHAIERGDIPPDTDVEVALDLLYGPVYHRILHGHAAVTESFANTLVDHVVAAVSRSSGGSR
jgi:AcrR family transcriptional regulator